MRSPEIGLSASGRQRAGDHGDCCRLARTVVSQQDGDVPFEQVYVQPFHGHLPVTVHLETDRNTPVYDKTQKIRHRFFFFFFLLSLVLLERVKTQNKKQKKKKNKKSL